MNPQPSFRLILFPWLAIRPVLERTSAALEKVLLAGRPVLQCGLLLLFLVLFWWGYVPIHELIHAGACLLCGGTVEELAIDSRYGGAWLAKVFPFVVADSEYAGQLTRFSIPNGVAFAFVDLAPYLLSLFGVTLLEVSRRRGSAALFSLGFLLAFAPVISVTGDYYEAASQVTSYLAASLDSDLPGGVLVSDDVFRLINELGEAGRMGPGIVIFLVLGLLASVHLVLVTFALQVIVADRLVAETD